MLKDKSTSSAIVIANGVLETGPALDQALQAATSSQAIVGADGGAELALELGLMPTLVIGDLDSISPNTLSQLAAQNVEIRRHSVDKDETDLELALLAAIEQGATTIWVIGALGGRLDQSLANIYLLAHPALKACSVRLVSGKEMVYLLQVGEHELAGEVGDTISLLPLDSDIHGITTSHLKYPLQNETLYLGPARGISNVIAAPNPTVSFTAGKLLVIHTTGRA